jgi:hypothetical protein
LTRSGRCRNAPVSGSPLPLKPALWGLLKHLQACLQSTFMLNSWWSRATFAPACCRPHTPSTDSLTETRNSLLRPLRAKSPITEAWLNLDFSSLDLDPVNRFNQPSLCPKDLYHGHIVYDIVPSPPKTDKDHKKFMANQINLLHGSTNAASHSPQRVCIVTDVSTPSLPLQSVAAFCLLHEGDLYNDWSAASLAIYV